jgi:hypothetical protein
MKKERKKNNQNQKLKCDMDCPKKIKNCMNHINSIGTKPTRSKLGWALVRDDVQAPGPRGAVMDGKDEGRGEGGGLCVGKAGKRRMGRMEREEG